MKNKRNRLLIGFGIVSILTLLVAVAINSVFPNDARTLKRFETGLKSIPNTSIKELRLQEQGNLFANITLSIKDKGEMRFIAVLPSYLNNSEYLLLQRIDSCTFDVYTFGYHNYGNTYASTGKLVGKDEPPYLQRDNSINIGTNGPFGKLLGIKINKLSDAVQNYDKILSQVKKWPEPKKHNVPVGDAMSSYVDPKEWNNVPFVMNKENYGLDFKYYYSAHCEK